MSHASLLEAPECEKWKTDLNVIHAHFVLRTRCYVTHSNNDTKFRVVKLDLLAYLASRTLDCGPSLHGLMKWVGCGNGELRDARKMGGKERVILYVCPLPKYF